MNQRRLAVLIGAGLGRAADVIGSAFLVYRPIAVESPVTQTPISTINGLFDPSDLLTVVTSDFRHQNQASFLGDATVLQPGDYLVGSQTWFVSHVEALRAASCILCNRMLTISKPATPASNGANAYGGTTVATNVTLAAGWPASVLAKTHIDIDPTRLPADTKTSYFEVLLPPIPGLDIVFGFLLTDEIGQTYTISSAELSLTGWRLLAGIQTT